MPAGEETLEQQQGRRSVLITGGTSGIGLAAAQRFAQAGDCVLIAGRNKARGAAALASFKVEERQRVRFVAADVARVSETERLVAACCEAYGGIDVLVNSAGVYVEGAIGDMTEALFDKVMDIDLKGTYFMCRAAVPELRQRAGSAIVNVGSDAGLHGNYFCTAYCAAKGGVSLLTRALALELAHDGVRVNAIAPGDVMTPLTERQLASAPDRAEALAEMRSVYPLGRIGTAAEAAAAIFYLASPEAAFITGTILSIDGGLTA